MTERQHLQRARMLLAHVAEGCSEAVAWRKVKPRSKASSDKSAADMFRREMRQIARHPDAPALAHDWWQEPKRCIGIDDRPCGKEIPRRQKRCKTCADEQISLDRRGYNRKYHRSHKESLNPKRNDRRRKRKLDEAAAAAKPTEEERRAKLPRLVEYNGKEYLYYPETGEWEIWGYRHFYDMVGTFVPVPPRCPVPPVPPGVPVPDGDRRQRQREASQPGRAPRADRQSSKQQNLPASSGKKRKAYPKRRCKTCAHPDRAAIDAELLQGVSLRTVGGRHGISSSALHRHRSRCVKEPTKGDILAPDDKGDAWREWDGTEWQRIAAPRRSHLREVRGRPNDVSWRKGWSHDNNFAFCRRVYRRRRAR